MRPDLLRDLFEKEENYWWNVSKREMVFLLLKSLGFLRNRDDRAVGADIGCGAGYTATVLARHYRMVGLDVSREALEFCRDRGIGSLCQMATTEFSLPFKTGAFDLVLALDVIEHIENDAQALGECRRILKDGGQLIVTVPAFMALWSPWDDALGHRRRYTAPGLVDTIHRAGLHINRLSYIFFFIFPVAFLFRRLKGIIQRQAGRYSTDFIPLPPLLNRLLILVGRLEQWIVTRLKLSFPFGLSLICVMTKKEHP